MVPATHGEQEGLLKAAFGPPLQDGWCPGTCKGTVQERNGLLVGHFSFKVRTR